MKRNSREAWKLLHRLEGKYVPSQSPLVKSQAVSSTLVGNSRIKIDKTHAKRIYIITLSVPVLFRVIQLAAYDDVMEFFSSICFIVVFNSRAFGLLLFPKRCLIF